MTIRRQKVVFFSTVVVE